MPQPGSNRGYFPLDMIEGFMIGVILWARRFSHSGLLRNDEVVQRIFDWRKGMASQSTFSHFFKKFDQYSNDKIFPALNKFWFSQLSLDKFTIVVEFSSEMIWSLYNQRADCENRIRELKYDYGVDGFCMEDFFSTAAAFRWSMVAYNPMSLFRLQVLNSKH